MTTRPSLHNAGPALLLGLLAFILTVEWRAQGSVASTIERRRERLVDVVEVRQRRTADLERRFAELQAEADAVAAGSRRAALRGLQVEADELARWGGPHALSGPGLVVELADATTDDTENPADSRIQDVDLQAVVNSLWDAGAEAISVGNQRLVSTSAIRNAGQAVLVNFRVLTSPYRVVALGPSEDLRARFERSAIARRFRSWSQVYGLGFHAKTGDDLTVPAFPGALRFRYARPVESTS